MKIELLKDNQQGKKGAIVKVAPALANYLIRCKGAKLYVAPKKEKKPTIKESLQVDKPEKKNDKPKATRKSKGKPKS